MTKSFDKVLTVLNSFENADHILETALKFSSQQNAVLEILFVYEKALFQLPDLFSSEDTSIDKDKIKKEIKERLQKLEFSGKCAIFVYVDDTKERVLNLTKDQDNLLIVTTYHKKITQKLVKKSPASFLILKDGKNSFEKIILPVDLTDETIFCINRAKNLFSKSDIRLLHDHNFILSKELREEEQKRYEALKKEVELEGDSIKEYFVSEVEFVEELYIIQRHLAEFINERDFDLSILCSHYGDYIFSHSISFDLIDMVETDMLILR
jgi:hypothetical protein